MATGFRSNPPYRTRSAAGHEIGWTFTDPTLAGLNYSCVYVRTFKSGLGTVDQLEPPLLLSAGASPPPAIRPLGLAISFHKRQSSRKLRLFVSVDSAAAVTVQAKVSAARKRSLGSAKRITRKLAAGRTSRLAAHFSRNLRRKIKAALRRGVAVKARLTVEARDDIGRERVKRLTVKLVR